MDSPVQRRRDLRDDGWTDGRIARALRAGRLVRVDYDRFVRPGAVASTEQVMARPGTATALSHGSAARVRDLPVSDARIHVLVPHGCRRRSGAASSVVVHQSRSWQAELRNGLLVTGAARTVADILRTSALAEAVSVADAALHRGLLEGSELRSEIAGGVRSNLRARTALDRCDGRAESPLESRLRLLLTLGGLPPDDLQHEVREAGRFVARVDLWYEAGVVVEADGYEFHRDRADYVADRRKSQAYARLGLTLLRFSWEDVHARPDVVVETGRTVLARRRAA